MKSLAWALIQYDSVLEEDDHMKTQMQREKMAM